jgi:hypothetical protein
MCLRKFATFAFMLTQEISSRTFACPPSGKLDFLWLEVTAKCNLTCTHCYAESGPWKPLLGAMSKQDWENVLAEARQSGCRRLQFIGGEPTLHPHLPDLIRFARAGGYDFIEVFINATRISPALIDLLRENGVAVAASFYSHDAETHDRITNRRQSWVQTVAGLKCIVAASLPVRVGVIEMEENVGHLPETIAFLKSLGVVSIDADRLRGVGRGDKAVVPSLAERLDELCGKCWQGKLCVTSSGEAFPCIFSRKTCLGNAKAGLGAILDGDKLRDFRRAIYHHRGGLDESDCMPGSDLPCNPDCNPNCNPNSDPCRPDDSCLPLFGPPRHK